MNSSPGPRIVTSQSDQTHARSDGEQIKRLGALGSNGMDTLERESLHCQGSIDETAWRQQTLPMPGYPFFSSFCLSGLRCRVCWANEGTGVR